MQILPFYKMINIDVQLKVKKIVSFDQSTFRDLQAWHWHSLLFPQPKEEIAKCLTESVKYVMDKKLAQATRKSRTPRRSEVQTENVFQSSTVVYTVSDATPFSDKWDVRFALYINMFQIVLNVVAIVTIKKWKGLDPISCEAHYVFIWY